MGLRQSLPVRLAGTPAHEQCPLVHLVFTCGVLGRDQQRNAADLLLGMRRPVPPELAAAPWDQHAQFPLSHFCDEERTLRDRNARLPLDIQHGLKHELYPRFGPRRPVCSSISIVRSAPRGTLTCSNAKSVQRVSEPGEEGGFPHGF